MIVAAAGLSLAASPAVSEMPTCPSFGFQLDNGFCIDKTPHFDKRQNLSGRIYCSTAADGAPNGMIQVDSYSKVSVFSVWKGSCKADCEHLATQWPPLLSLSDVTAALCP